VAESARLEELRRRVEADPASIAFAALAEEFRRVGRHADAIDTCRTGLQRHPAYLSARVTLGRALIEIGDYEAAREELETVLRSAPENLAAIRGLAQIHERLGHSTEMHPDLHEIAREPIRLAAEHAQRLKDTPPPAPPEPAMDFTLAREAPGPELAEVSFDLPLSTPAEPELVPASIDDEPRTGEPLDIFAAALQQPAAAPFMPLPEPEAALPPAAFDLAPAAADAPESLPDPSVAALLLRLERFLGAIETARHA
jgi:tetratricopeptide (TPR) repeat protein